MSEFLGIDINILNDGVFRFYQIELIRMVMKSTGLEHCNRLLTPTKVEAPLGIDDNYSEAKRYCTNSYASVIDMILYLESNTRPDISSAIHQCDWFTHKTKSSHNTDVNMMCCYL